MAEIALAEMVLAELVLLRVGSRRRCSAAVPRSLARRDRSAVCRVVLGEDLGCCRVVASSQGAGPKSAARVVAGAEAEAVPAPRPVVAARGSVPAGQAQAPAPG